MSASYVEDQVKAEEQRRALAEPDGCGLFPFVVKDKRFVECCMQHDKDYILSADNTQTRLESDRRFLRCCLRKAKTRWDRVRAWAYYGVVRSLGGLWWDGRK